MHPATLSHHLLTQAYNNDWANHRLHEACAKLDDDAFHATRTSFFPSIHTTLNHILIVDRFYIDALEREASGRPPHPNPGDIFSNPVPCPTVSELRHAQGAADGRLLRYCAQLDDATLDRIVTIVRPQRLQHDTRRRLLAHLFEHQTHHRGQAHAMLAGTTVKPPQLDEFFPAGEADLRAADFAALGWTESMIWDDGVAPPPT